MSSKLSFLAACLRDFNMLINHFVQRMASNTNGADYLLVSDRIWCFELTSESVIVQPYTLSSQDSTGVGLMVKEQVQTYGRKLHHLG